MQRLTWLVVFLGGLSLTIRHASAAAEGRPMTVDDLLAIERLADPEISPDGRWVVYVATRADVAKNSTSSTLWLVSTEGGAPRQLTTTDKKDSHPRFSPDSKQVLFQSNRSGSLQLWVIDVDGGEARQLTRLASEASGALWSPDGKWIAFVSAVFPEYSSLAPAEADAAHQRRIDEAEKNPVKARVFDRLFFRHWDSWVEGKRQHLFVLPASGGEPRDVTPGDWDAYPTSTTFSVGDDFTFTPDGRALVFTAPAQVNEAWNTNHDLWRVSIEGGPAENLTEDNPAADGCPRFSPDGRWLAYRAQSQAGFEADRWQLYVRPAAGGKARSLTAELDASVDQLLWTADGSALLFLAEVRGATSVYRVPRDGGGPKPFATGGSIASLSAANSGERAAALRATMSSPPEVCLIDGSGKLTVVSQANRELLARLDLPRPESVDVPGAGGTPMQMWILKPPGFDPSQRWPLVYLVHGGPQGAWTDSWSYRWNPEVWAAQGYVVAMPNPRGSTGFGQQYVNEISGDWGGKCFEDLMAGADYLARLPYVDPQRMAAAGASFGGYMMNWFAGHTDRFRTLICHCGVFNFDSMYASTEEIWFDEWEHGGPPWVNRESYEKYSPHLFAGNFKTPMLIIHNDQDFRVPVGEGLMMFTVLQRLGVPSKMINFPDEGHWVLKPANSVFWHQEIFAWLKQYCPAGPQ